MKAGKLIGKRPVCAVLQALLFAIPVPGETAFAEPFA
jgi:hypothetical protein